MENTNGFVIKKTLGIADYVILVKEISEGFFDFENGKYVPYIGEINAMRLFYNECVLDSKYDIPHDTTDVVDMQELLDDEDFILSYNDAIKGDGVFRLDFANAYRQAIDIVNVNKGSLERIVNILSASMNKFVEKTAPMMTEENIERLVNVAKDVSNGNMSADSLIEALANSQKIKQ